MTYKEKGMELEFIQTAINEYTSWLLVYLSQTKTTINYYSF